MSVTWLQRVHWLRVQLRDAVELFLLPSFALFLPWSWCFALYRRMAHWSWLYRLPALRAMDAAAQMGWVEDARDWLVKRKLVTLVDHADHFLAMSRSNRWMQRFVQVQGHWPLPGQAAVLCTFHWGAGMWSLRHARNAGLNVNALAAPLDGMQFVGRPLLQWYARARTGTVMQEMGRETMDASGSMRPVLKALKNQEQVLAVVDVPADAVTASINVDLLGMKARMPRGLLRLAADQGLPVTVFTVGVCLDTGKRMLQLRSFEVTRDAEALVQGVFAVLDAAIRQEPAAWHFWGEADRFFVYSQNDF